MFLLFFFFPLGRAGKKARLLLAEGHPPAVAQQLPAHPCTAAARCCCPSAACAGVLARGWMWPRAGLGGGR